MRSIGTILLLISALCSLAIAQTRPDPGGERTTYQEARNLNGGGGDSGSTSQTYTIGAPVTHENQLLSNPNTSFNSDAMDLWQQHGQRNPDRNVLYETDATAVERTYGLAAGPGCPAGQAPNPATGVCEPVCPAGESYNPGSGACEPACPAGESYNVATGVCEPITCPAGEFVNPSTGACEPNHCPSGWFPNAAGVCEEANCPAGEFPDISGNCQPNTCPLGEQPNAAGVCEPFACPAGTILTATNTCTPVTGATCPPDRFPDGDGNCVSPAARQAGPANPLNFDGSGTITGCLRYADDSAMSGGGGNVRATNCRPANGLAQHGNYSFNGLASPNESSGWVDVQIGQYNLGHPSAPYFTETSGVTLRFPFHPHPPIVQANQSIPPGITNDLIISNPWDCNGQIYQRADGSWVGDCNTLTNVYIELGQNGAVVGPGTSSTRVGQFDGRYHSYTYAWGLFWGMDVAPPNVVYDPGGHRGYTPTPSRHNDFDCLGYAILRQGGGVSLNCGSERPGDFFVLDVADNSVRVTFADEDGTLREGPPGFLDIPIGDRSAGQLDPSPILPTNPHQCMSQLFRHSSGEWYANCRRVHPGEIDNFELHGDHATYAGNAGTVVFPIAWGLFGTNFNDNDWFLVSNPTPP